MHYLKGAIDKVNKALYFGSAFLILAIATMIIIDVGGRNLFNTPLTGTIEVVSNTVILIAFLQLCFSIRSGGMFRATAVYDLMPAPARLAIDMLRCLAGALVFGLICYASWSPMLDAWATREYYGGGEFQFITYPVRTVIVFCSGFACLNYLLLACEVIVSVKNPVTPSNKKDESLDG